MTATNTCVTCEQTAQGDAAPPWQRIAGDAHWRVTHAFNAALPGWLVLVPRRHVLTIADLTEAEADALGSWQVRLSRALHAVTGCAKTYVAQFAEADGFAHVHFHVIPRMTDLPGDVVGPRVFGLLGKDDRQRVQPAAMNELAVRLSTHLAPPAMPLGATNEP